MKKLTKDPMIETPLEENDYMKNQGHLLFGPDLTVRAFNDDCAWMWASRDLKNNIH